MMCEWRECEKPLPEGCNPTRKYCDNACKKAADTDRALIRREQAEDIERAMAERGPRADHKAGEDRATSPVLKEIDETLGRRPFYAYRKEPYSTIGGPTSEREKLLSQLWHKRRLERLNLPLDQRLGSYVPKVQPTDSRDARRKPRPSSPLRVCRGGKLDQVFQSSAAFTRHRKAAA